MSWYGNLEVVKLPTSAEKQLLAGKVYVDPEQETEHEIYTIDKIYSIRLTEDSVLGGIDWVNIKDITKTRLKAL